MVLTKVLIVEDNDVARFVATQIVSQCDCEPQAASNGSEALALIRTKQFDIILMDIGLPDTTGIEVTKKIRKEGGINQTVPIVALTAHDDEESQTNAILVGMNSFLVKPLTKEKLEEALKHHIIR